ncbi:hypothetical protein ACJEKU_06405, partial [Escherichia coli]
KRAYCLKTQPATGETYPKSDLFNKALQRVPPRPLLVAKKAKILTLLFLPPLNTCPLIFAIKSVVYILPFGAKF